MENNLSVNPDFKKTNFLLFRGEGMALAKILIVNFFLTIVTLGLYHPWAKANILKFLYQETEFKGSRFNFSGTGKEMFRGYIKVYSFFIVVFLALFAAQFYQKMTLYFIIIGVFYLVLILILPFAIHGSTKYRMSRSSWRSIRFGYRGDRMELAKLFFKGLLFTILTLGVYLFWFNINLKKYIMNHTRFGDIEFRFKGNGLDFFLVNLKGIFLTILTCGIYSFWYEKDLFYYEISNTEMIQNGNTLNFTTDMTGVEYMMFSIVNSLLILFTLGLALPWVICRTLEFFYSNIDIMGHFDDNALKQTEEKYTNAAGDEFMDQTEFDLGLFDF